MFDPYCPSCRRTTLLGPRRVDEITATPEGPVVRLRCFCGTSVVWPSPTSFDVDALAAVPAPAT